MTQPLALELGQVTDPARPVAYAHVQPVPSTTWTIIHNLGRYAVIQAVNHDGQVILTDIRQDSVDQATLTFGRPTSGHAYVA